MSSWAGVHQDAADAVTVSACSTGIVVAVAPLIPEVVRFLVLTAVTCILVIAIVCWIAARAVDVTKARGTDLFLFVLAACGLLVVVIGATHLSLIRLNPEYHALSYNIDWRYAWTHAQGIARFGSLENSLELAGTQVIYHVGPSWIAGAFQRILGIDVAATLFGIVPFASVVAAVVAMEKLCSSGSRTVAGIFAAAIVLNLPGVTGRFPSHLITMFERPAEVLWHGDTWFFPSLMLNSTLALSVGLSALALLTSRTAKNGGWFGMAGLASVVAIKPQYFVGIGLLFAIYGIRVALADRTYRPLALGAACLALAIVIQFGLGRGTGAFAFPVLNPGNGVIRPIQLVREVFRLPWIISYAALGLAFVAIRRYRLRWLDASDMIATLSTAAVAVLILLFALVMIEIRLLPEAEAVLSNLGLSRNLSSNFAQSLIPLRVLLTGIAIALLISSAKQFGRYLQPMIALAMMTSGLAYCLYTTRDLRDPLAGYEAAMDRDLYRSMKTVEPEGHLFISSDLGDPAQNYRRGRSLLSPLLSAYHGHQFYLSNAKYSGWKLPETSARLRELRVFFGSPWSDWHNDWLSNAGITHILTNTRCRPIWTDEKIPLEVVEATEKWTLFKVSERGRDPARIDIEPPWEDLSPAYGESECLTGWHDPLTSTPR